MRMSRRYVWWFAIVAVTTTTRPVVMAFVVVDGFTRGSTSKESLFQNFLIARQQEMRQQQSWYKNDDYYSGDYEYCQRRRQEQQAEQEPLSFLLPEQDFPRRNRNLNSASSFSKSMWSSRPANQSRKHFFDMKSPFFGDVGKRPNLFNNNQNWRWFGGNAVSQQRDEPKLPWQRLLQTAPSSSFDTNEIYWNNASNLNDRHKSQNKRLSRVERGMLNTNNKLISSADFMSANAVTRNNGPNWPSPSLDNNNIIDTPSSRYVAWNTHNNDGTYKHRFTASPFAERADYQSLDPNAQSLESMVSRNEYGSSSTLPSRRSDIINNADSQTRTNARPIQARNGADSYYNAAKVITATPNNGRLMENRIHNDQPRTRRQRVASTPRQTPSTTRRETTFSDPRYKQEVKARTNDYVAIDPNIIPISTASVVNGLVNEAQRSNIQAYNNIAWTERKQQHDQRNDERKIGNSRSFTRPSSSGRRLEDTQAHNKAPWTKSQQLGTSTGQSMTRKEPWYDPKYKQEVRARNTDYTPIDPNAVSISASSAFTPLAKTRSTANNNNNGQTKSNMQQEVFYNDSNYQRQNRGGMEPQPFLPDTLSSFSPSVVTNTQSNKTRKSSSLLFPRKRSKLSRNKRRIVRPIYPEWQVPSRRFPPQPSAPPPNAYIGRRLPTRKRRPYLLSAQDRNDKKNQHNYPRPRLALEALPNDVY